MKSWADVLGPMARLTTMPPVMRTTAMQATAQPSRRTGGWPRRHWTASCGCMPPTCQVSLEDAAWQHGAFTRALLDALNDPKAPIDHWFRIFVSGRTAISCSSACRSGSSDAQLLRCRYLLPAT